MCRSTSVASHLWSLGISGGNKQLASNVALPPISFVQLTSKVITGARTWISDIFDLLLEKYGLWFSSQAMNYRQDLKFLLKLPG